MAKPTESAPIEFSDLVEEGEVQTAHIPKEERHLRTQAYDMSISDIVTKIENNDIILDPHYQRTYIWEDKRASLLIESILLNVPIPVIYVAEDEDGAWEVVDGLQRLHSLRRYFGGEFKLKGLEVLDELNGDTYTSLNSKAARILRNGILRIILVFKESHPDIKYEIFMRLNRGAVKLSEQELRNCLHRGPFNDLLHSLREETLIQVLFGLDAPHSRMADAELLLRHFTVKAGYDGETGTIATYSGNMRSSLNRYMEKVRNLATAEIDSLRAECLQDAKKVFAVFGDHAFNRITKEGDFDGRVNRAIMDAVWIGFGFHSLQSLVTSKDDAVALLRRLINEDPKFDDAITTRTSDKARMEYRVHTFAKDLSMLLRG